MKSLFFSIFIASVVFLLVLFLYPEQTLTQADIDRLNQKKQDLIQKTHTLYGFNYNVPLYIEETDKRVWGAMLYSGGMPQKIVINKGYYLENPDYVVNFVLPHEWAHVVARLIYKTSIRSHGEEWLAICKSLSEIRCDVRVQDEFVAEEKIRSSLRELLGGE